MTAQDNLNSRQFFHGTKAKLEPGDMIEPGHSTGWTDTAQTRDHKATHVYATTRMDDARYFADSANNGLPFTRDPATGIYSKPTNSVGRRYVYEVEPTGRMMQDPNENARQSKQWNGATGYRTRKPMRVTKLIDTWDN